jgi:Zn-dependent peptidase ImmA (M78 family)/transcriptional regulator with XRE-family HTH domain
VSTRLREAREARSLTVTSLADLLGVSASAVSQYEKGQHSPAPPVMRKIAQALNVPLHFFLIAKPPDEDNTKFWRSMSAATQAARVRAYRRFDWFREVVAFIARFVHLPTVKFPDLGFGEDPTPISDADIEEAATKVRRVWNLGDGPISNVLWLVENNGAVVGRHRLDADTLDAFSEWSHTAGRPYIILGSDKGSAVRSRFDAGHELGHMILHRRVPKTAITKGELFSLVEHQANRFASAFLLPERTFSEDFYTPSIDALCAQKPKWRASIALMIKRSQQLGLVSDQQARRLYINLTRRGWKHKEPLDDTLEPESPRFVKRSIELVVGKNIIARHDLPFQLALPASDIEELTGLPAGYLGGEPSLDVELLQMPRTGEETDQTGSGTVPSILPFTNAN